MSERRESITPSKTRSQSASGPPVQEIVTVAVLPPRMAPGQAPPTGIAASDAFSWDEAVNWQHNEKLNQGPENLSKAKSFSRKIGLTTQRKKANKDAPPFIFRKVPYDTWRKHYAKDKNGRYHGTHAPAEDCLLLPEDVEIWRLGPAETKADLWTRGKEALPVYAEAQQQQHDAYVPPEYSERYDGPPPEEPRLDSVSSDATGGGLVPMPSGASRTSSYTADGKTSEQIIKEAKEKAEAKKMDRRGNWKERIKRGAEIGLMGSN